MEYKISSGKYTAVVSSKGAELVSLSDGEREYIWTGDPAYWGGHNPLLFPVIGRMKEGRVFFGGMPFNMPKHGFARNMNFREGRVLEDRVTLVLDSNSQTRESFPFDFRLYVTDTVLVDGFKTTYTVENIGDSSLICNIGGHTGINLAGFGEESVDGFTLEFSKQENACVYYGDENLFIREDYRLEGILDGTAVIPLSQGLFDGDALMIDRLASDSVKLVAPSGHGIRMNFSGFPVLGVWTPPEKNAPFVCLEPWHGLPALACGSAEFRDKPHLVTVEPDEKKALSYSVEIF